MVRIALVKGDRVENIALVDPDDEGAAGWLDAMREQFDEVREARDTDKVPTDNVVDPKLTRAKELKGKGVARTPVEAAELIDLLAERLGL